MRRGNASLAHPPTTRPPSRNISFLKKYIQTSIANIKEKTGNYLVLKKSTVTVYWNAYKTSKTHGSVSTELPKDLARILRRHCKFMKTHFPDNANLFLNARFEPMTRQNLGKLLENLFYSYFKKRISVSSLRRMYLSSKYSHKVIQEAREDARKMLHQVSVAQDNYVKKVNEWRNRILRPSVRPSWCSRECILWCNYMDVQKPLPQSINGLRFWLLSVSFWL